MTDDPRADTRLLDVLAAAIDKERGEATPNPLSRVAAVGILAALPPDTRLVVLKPGQVVVSVEDVAERLWLDRGPASMSWADHVERHVRNGVDPVDCNWFAKARRLLALPAPDTTGGE